MAKYIIYDGNDKKLDILQNYTSMQWISAYNETGKFELHAFPTESNLKNLVEGNRIVNQSTNEIGFIEFVLGDTDQENNETLEIRGYLNNLKHRINSKTKTIRNVEKDLYALINDNKRGLDVKTDVLKNLTETIEKETTWDELSETVNEVCQTTGLGHRMIKREKMMNLFEIYKKGINEKVVFSDKNKSILSQSFIRDISSFKNYAFVAAEGKGEKRFVIEIDLTNGGPRRELYVDARNVSKTYKNSSGEDIEYSDEEYKKIVQEFGLKKLLENKKKSEFDCEIDTSSSLFVFRKDFDLGDVIKVESRKYGILKYFRISKVNEINEDGESFKFTLSPYEEEASILLRERRIR